jgi:transcriptional regulator with XRE-family HTH domain
MLIEENLENARKQVENAIKIGLIEKNMTQIQLAQVLGERRAAVNLAVKGSTTPKSVAMRKEIYKVLGME